MYRLYCKLILSYTFHEQTQTRFTNDGTAQTRHDGTAQLCTSSSGSRAVQSHRETRSTPVHAGSSLVNRVCFCSWNAINPTYSGRVRARTLKPKHIMNFWAWVLNRKNISRLRAWGAKTKTIFKTMALNPKSILRLGASALNPNHMLALGAQAVKPTFVFKPGP